MLVPVSEPRFPLYSPQENPEFFQRGRHPRDVVPADPHLSPPSHTPSIPEFLNSQLQNSESQRQLHPDCFLRHITWRTPTHILSILSFRVTSSEMRRLPSRNVIRPLCVATYSPTHLANTLHCNYVSLP